MNLKQNRQQLLPNIKDWTSDHLDLKYTRNVKKQKYDVWFWFSPDNYKLIKIGFPLVFTLFLSTGAYICYLKDFMLAFVTLSIFAVIGFVGLIKTILAYPTYKTLNMYEVHLQDKPEDIIIKEIEDRE